MSAEPGNKHRLFLLVLLAALGLRFIGIWYGLPALYNSDEPFNVVQALSYGAKKSLAPTYFVYPTLYSYFLFAVYGMYYLAGKALGIFASPLDFGAAYFLNPTGLFFWGRLAGVILGTAAVGLVFQIGRRYFSGKIGLLAAAMLAFSFVHVDLSHWILLEPAAALITALALYGIFRFNENPTIKTNFLASLVCGLALSTKYNAGLIFLPVLIVAFLNYKSNPVKLVAHLGLSVLFFLLGFIMGTPYWVIAFSKFWSTLKYTFAHVSTGMPGHLRSVPLVWPLGEMVFQDWGVGLMLVAGVIYALFQRERKSLLLAASVLPTLLMIGLWKRTGIHYLMPIYPALSLCAALFLVSALEFLKSKKWQAAMFVLLFLPPVLKILYYDIRLTQKDSRAWAQEWIEANIPLGSSIAYENYVYGPNLFDPARFLKSPSESQFIPVELREKLLQERQLRPSYNLVNLRKDFRAGDSTAVDGWRFRNDYVRQIWETRLPKLTAVKNAGVEYLLTSSDNYNRYFLTEPEPGTPVWLAFQNGRAFYTSAFESKDLVLLKEFRAGFLSLGPTVRIYQFKNEAHDKKAAK